MGPSFSFIGEAQPQEPGPRVAVTSITAHPLGKLWVKVTTLVFHSGAQFGLTAGLNVRTKQESRGLNRGVGENVITYEQNNHRPELSPSNQIEQGWRVAVRKSSESWEA